MSDAFQPLIEEFCTYLRGQKNYSSETLRAYRNDLEEWRVQWADQGITDCGLLESSWKSPQIRQAMASLLSRDRKRGEQAVVSRTTVAREVATLRSVPKILQRS